MSESAYFWSHPAGAPWRSDREFNPWPALPVVEMKKQVVVSGHFLIVHSGHARLINAAAALGHLTIVVNNDKQVALKGAVPFLGEGDRVALLKELYPGHRVILSIDEDGSVCKTLRLLHSLGMADVFANGGDATAENCREAEVCRELGIEAVYGVGGQEKTFSSSSLIEGAARWVAVNRWGFDPASLPPAGV